MVVAFYFRLHLAYFPRPVVAIFARPEQPLVAKTLGCSLTVAYRLLKRDDFPHTVSGQRVYIDKGKFLSWLDAQTQMEKRDHYGW